MKLSEYLEDLDPKLARGLERAMTAVREEFEEKLNATVEATVTAAGEEAAALAAQASATPATGPAVSLEAADELRLAALDIDTASSQSEILEALSRGVLRFTTRVAIFVNRGDEVHGWSATGFGEADSRIKEVSFGGGQPFPKADQLIHGSVALSSEDCTSICDTLGAEHASMGLSMPFVLGDQVVGTVYCDRVGDEVFSVSALQLLTYLAGQTLETLPVRKRQTTATLSLSAGETETVEAETHPPAAAESIPAVEEEVAPSHVEPVTDEFEAAPGVIEVDEAEDAVETSETEGDIQPGTLEAPSALPTAISEPSSASLPAIEDEAPSSDTSHGAATSMADSSAQQPGETAPAPAPPVIGLSSTQVSPPEDLEGPGWAFASSAGPTDSSSESEEEEAQRLARLLVTEIKLYNEEAVEEGRRDANVYSRLQEDIDRSRQIFEDRIDPALRDENDYFKQALVRILAGGDPSLLGI